jgi:hypothetical protein
MFRTTQIAIAVAAVLLLKTASAGAATLYVDPSGQARKHQAYTSIQKAVDVANPGDTILVYPATYTENVIITTDHLTLRGWQHGRDPTRINPRGSESIIDGYVTIDAAYVTVNGFTVSTSAGNWGIGISPKSSGGGGPPDLPVNAANNCIIANNIIDCPGGNDYGIAIIGPNVVSDWIPGCSDVSNTLVRHNVISSGNAAMDIGGANEVYVIGNVIVSSGGGPPGIDFANQGASTNCVVKFNHLNGYPINVNGTNILVEHNYDVGP